MNDLKCDLFVYEIGSKDRIEKEKAYSTTLVGAIRLKPDETDPRQDGLDSETVGIKVVITDVAQLDLLRANGIGTKGDTKELILQLPPQTRLDRYETSEQRFEA
jgi:hypothetical protein